MATKKRTTRGTFRVPESHPWLTFQLDLSRAPIRLWTNLGAAQSKCEHVANTLLPPEVADQLDVLYLAKGIQATTAIEGNTLSEREVRERIQGKSQLPKSKEYQGQEIDNIVAAWNDISRRAVHDEDCRLSEAILKEFNRQVQRNLPLEDGVVPGEFRTHSVVVGRSYRGVPARDCQRLVERMCQWVNQELRSDADDLQIAFGILRAVMAHLYLAWIHPFGDGNGRTARLAELQLLIGAGVPAISAHLLSNHYNQTRSEYYRQLAAASKSGGNVLPFVEYAVQGFVDGLSAQIEHIRKHQHWMTWKDYVYEQFKNLRTASAQRQRRLALALGEKQRDWVRVASIPQLTPELAADYAGKTFKTVARDVAKLVRMRLVSRSKGLVRASHHRLQRFLPPRREEDKRL